MGEIAGGILLAVAVLAVVQSRAGAMAIAVFLVLALLGTAYLVWGWAPVIWFGFMITATVVISMYENRRVRAYIPEGRSIYSQYERKDES